MKLTVFTAGLFLVMQVHAMPSILHVPADYPTIQEAIDAAAVGDQVLVAPGTYPENIDFLGKAITVKAAGSVGSAAIDGGQNGQPVVTFTNQEGADSVLCGFLITNGQAISGGGIHCVNASPTLAENVISLNRADNGGGIHCYWYSFPIISDSIISANAADKYGAGIYCFKSSATITKNEIIENVAYEKAGGIYCFDSSPSIIVNSIRDNETSHGSGGAILCNTHSAPTIEGNDISDNYSSHDGGGICCELGSSPLIENNTILNNRAHYGGGGIDCGDSSPVIRSNTISGNYSYQGAGAGISIGFSAAPIIENNTISSNRSWHKAGGGVFSAGSPIIMNNTISYNMALEGGGIQCSWASPQIIGNEIFENETENDGAGIRCWDCLETSRIQGNNIFDNRSTSGSGGGIQSYSSETIILDNTILGNEAASGAGIHCHHGDDPLLAGNVIQFNQATGGGGGIHCKFYDGVFVNNVIASNTADSGGGLFCEYSYPVITNSTVYNNSAIEGGGGLYCLGHSVVNVWNSLLWENGAPEGKEAWVGDSTLRVVFCDLEGGQSSVYADPYSYIEWGEGMIDADPLFADASEMDFHLRFTSPCRDGGDNLYVLDFFDFEGDPRIAQGTVDMGADEFHTHLYVTGDQTPGGAIQGKLVGMPGTATVGLLIGSGILDPPVQTAWGSFFLQAPWSMIPLIPIPSDGILALPAVIPPAPPAPYDLPMQALIGLDPDSLTNVELLQVR
jgi:parallel beta-helix repeat protein